MIGAVYCCLFCSSSVGVCVCGGGGGYFFFLEGCLLVGLNVFFFGVFFYFTFQLLKCYAKYHEQKPFSLEIYSMKNYLYFWYYGDPNALKILKC